jgi:hypothetical protein
MYLPPSFRAILFLLLALVLPQWGWGQTTIGIHDFETVNASPAMTRSTATTSGSPGFSGVVTGNSPSSSASPASSPYFTSSNSGYRQAGPSSGTAIVTHTFDAVDTRSYTGVSVSLRVASMSIGSSSNGIESDDYCEIAVSPDNGTTWYQQSRLVGGSTSNSRWAFSGTGSSTRSYLANNTFTTHAAPGSGGLLTGTNAITTLTVTGLPSVQNLRVRVQTRNDSANESWVIDDVRVSGTLAITAPTVTTTTPATSITPSSATAGGNITATGGANATVRGIEYSTTDGFANGTGTPVTELGSFGTGTFTRDLSGLSAGTTYYFKAFATNTGGTGYGAQQSFLTLPAAPATPTASAVGPNGFTVNWSPVTSATGYRLDVSTASDFSSFVTGYNDLTVAGTSQAVTGLNPDTTYYARVRAVNATGTSANSGTLTQDTAAATSPTITRTPGTLSGFTYVFDAGPSASDSFTVSAANLSPAAGNLTVSAAGSDYEVSTDDSIFSTSVDLPYTSGTLSTTTVHVRLKSALTVGSYDSQTLDISGGGATTQTLTLSGSVTSGSPPSLTAAPAANVDAAFDVTFADNATWRGGITGITVDGTPLTAGFSASAGTLTFTPSASVPAGLLQTAGTKDIVITSTNYSTATVSQAIAAGAATELAVVTEPTAPASNGAALATQPVVEIRDQYGNLTASTATVTAAVGSGTWTLGGTAAVDAVSGTVTFSGLTATSASAVTGATIDFSSPSLTGATSASFNIPAPDFIQLIAAPVTENFDGMAATTTLPNGWKMAASTSSPTWTGAASTVTQQASSGSPSTGGTYNWGTSASERAVGAMTSGSFASPNSLLVKVRNSTGGTLDALEISYQAERYRVNTAAASVQLSYSLNGTTWTAITAGDIASTEFPTGTSSYTFATPLTITRADIAQTGLGLADGAFIYFRWNINTTGSNSQGIGIDNISIALPKTPQTITGLAAAETRLVGAPNYNLAATASSSLAVAYSSSDENVATISGSTVTVVGAGTTTITATQAGDATYAAAPPVTQTLTILPTTWTLIEDFTGLDTASPLAGQNGWATADTFISSNVVADPGDAGNKVGILQDGFNIQNYKNLAIAGPNQISTMFLRFRIGKIDNLTTTNNETAAYMGVTDAAIPSVFGNFRAQWGTSPAFSTTAGTSPFHLVSHDPTPINKFVNQQPADSLWYHAWAVLDKSTAKYSLYLQGGEFTSPTLVTQVSTLTSAFDFRNGGNLSDTETLKVFLRSGGAGNHLAPLYFDDIYFAAGENLTPPVTPVHVPIIATGTSGSITRTTAEISVNDVTSDGNSAITERGVVFSTSANPTIADTKVVVSGTTGTFDASLTGLTGGTTYHVRAFATNAIGTAYGSEVSFSANGEPVFSGMALNTTTDSPVQVTEDKILARITDPENDTVTITGVAASSAGGGSVSRNGGIITYTPAAAFSGSDTFTVTINDGFGAVDITLTVTVTADPLFTSPANAPRLTDLPGGAKRIAFNGIPGRTYGIQRSTTMEPDSWEQIAAVQAAADSTVSYDDPTPPQPSAFYRIAYPAQ